MEWLLIGLVAGSLVASGHKTEEECLGRRAVLDKQKITATCVKAPSNFGVIGSTPCLNCFTVPLTSPN